MFEPLSTKPVASFGTPAYPTRLAALADPGLLRSHRPLSWRSSRELAGLASALLAAGPAGCSKSGSFSSAGFTPCPDAPAVVAPLFEHGEGRGAAGCVVTTPPVFLSEEEAFQIISEELQRKGVALSMRDVEFPSVEVKLREYREEHEWVSGGKRGAFTYFDAPFRADGMDPDHRVAIEFTSIRDFGRSAGPWHDDNDRSSVATFDMKQVANYISDQIRGKPASTYFGLFYDPLAGRVHLNELMNRRHEESADGKSDSQWMRDELHAMEEEAKAESERLLREQVRDFVEWLKAQGVI